MSDDKHTGGADAVWEVVNGLYIEDASPFGIGVGKAFRLNSADESEANARLMAAAPEMLRALRHVLSDLYSHPDKPPSTGAQNAVLEAIQKATFS